MSFNHCRNMNGGCNNKFDVVILKQLHILRGSGVFYLILGAEIIQSGDEWVDMVFVAELAN